MKEKKTREDYESSYEWRREQLWKDVKLYEEDTFPNIISYFVKSGTTPISGKVKQVPQPLYKGEMEIKEGFRLLKDLMHTKQGKLRKSMEELRDYEEYTLIALINYMRESWVEKETTLQLTWQEFFLLKEGAFKKPKNKKK